MQQSTPRQRAVALLLASAAALLAAWAAPGAWPDGPATVEVRVGSRDVVAVAVVLGGDEAVAATAASPGAGEVGVEVDRDGRLVVDVRTADAQDAAAVEVVVLLSDGSREVVPVVRVEGPAATAVRHPPRGAPVVLGLLAFVAVLWVGGAFALHLPSLLVPVVLAVGGVGTATEVLAPFFHPIVVLFLAGFLLAIAMQRVGLDELVANAIVARASGGPVVLLGTVLALAAFLSMWMSNTAAVAVLVPIALAVSEPLDSPGYRRALVLGLAWAATIGGIGSAIGTPANPLAIDFLEQVAGNRITFVGWFAYGLPVVLLLVPVVGAWVWWTGDVEVDRERFDAARVAAVERLRGQRLTGGGGVVLAVFVAIMAGWLTQGWHGLDTGLVALAGALVLAALGRIAPDDLAEVNWSALLTFGGGLSLGVHLTRSGVADWVATRLDVLAGAPTTLAVLVVATATLVMTTLASNTATAAMLVPLAIPLAGIVGVDPVVLVLVVAIASSIDFALVIGTPPTMLAFATGLFSTREIFRRGIVLDLVGIAVLVLVVVPLWRLLGLTA